MFISSIVLFYDGDTQKGVDADMDWSRVKVTEGSKSFVVVNKLKVHNTSVEASQASTTVDIGKLTSIYYDTNEGDANRFFADSLASGMSREEILLKLFKSDETEILISRFSVNLTGHDIKTLKPLAQVNDEVMNMCMQILNLKAKGDGSPLFWMK